MTPKTIVLKGQGIRKEAKADGVVTPGHLVHTKSDGDVGFHSIASGHALPAFAVENELVGKGIDTDYAAADTLYYEVLQPGSVAFALVGANAPAIVIGDLLESAGDGTLRLAPADVTGVRAKITVGLADAAVEFEAAMIGDEGNDITIEYLTATAATATVVVTGLAIVVKPDDTTPGTTDQAADVVALINASAEASALVVARATGTGLDAVVEPVAATNLAGGLDTTAGSNSVAVANEAVDNSAGGTPVRIKAEVL